MRDFQAQCTRAKEMAASVHQHCVDLQSMLRAAAAEALSMGVLLDYVEAKEELVEREERGRGRQGEVWQACDWRERRLDLTIQLNQFERDVKEVRIHLPYSVCVCSFCYCKHIHIHVCIYYPNGVQ